MAIDILTLDQPSISIPDSARTLDGFRNWMASDECPERGRFAFLENRLVVDMSPEHPDFHVDIKQEISLAIQLLNREHNLGRFYSDGILFTNPDANISNQPAATLILWETLKSQRAQFMRRRDTPTAFAELVCSPDWVLEVVSPSSVRKNTRVLRKVYFDAGIREYWLVDACGGEIDFQILVRGEEGFVAVDPQDGMTASQVLPASFRLTGELDCVGLWKYTLHAEQRWRIWIRTISDACQNTEFSANPAL